MKTYQMTELYRNSKEVLSEALENGVLLQHKSFNQPFLFVSMKNHTKAIDKYNEIEGMNKESAEHD